MSTPYSDLSIMSALPVASDTLLVVTGNGADLQRIPMSLMSTAWVQRQASVPSSPTFSQGAAFTIASNTEYLFFRNGTQWARIPYEASNWADDYNRLLRPTAPSLAEDPVGSPDGHYYYNSGDEVFRFKQGGAYVSLETPRGYKLLSDGANTANADTAGELMLRSGDDSLTITVTDDDLTYGDVINFVVNTGAINVGDFLDDETYALKVHDHDGVYSLVAHDHDGVYSPVGHDHDGTYSLVGHTHAGTYAAISHGHAATDLTSGTLVDARVAATNVTQHVAAINHDALLNYSSNRHIDHSAVSVVTASNSGLAGGGDLTSSRSLVIDLLNLPSLATPDLALDSIMVYDVSAGGLRRCLLSTLGFDVANHNHTAAQITSGTLASARGGLGANASAFTGMLKMSSGIASVAVANTDYSAPGHGHDAADISDFSDAVTAVTGDLSDIALNTAARHTQNTDTGTTSSYFQLLTGTDGGRLYWHNATQEFRCRNFDNSDFADLRVGNLVVEGTTTTLISNEVNIGDSVILLNSDITLNSQNSDGGLDVKLLAADNSTRRDVGLHYNATTYRWQMSGFEPTSAAPTTKAVCGKHAEDVGDGVATSFNVAHGLKSLDVIVAIVENATGDMLGVDWTVVDEDNISVTFGAAPAADACRVIVIG